MRCGLGAGGAGLVQHRAGPACRPGAGSVRQSGAGLFHGIVNPQDGAHARFNRIAALEAQRAVGWAVRDQGVPGALSGVLRLHDRDSGWAAMASALRQLGLPADYVQAVDASEASARAGLRLALPAWRYPGGGWVQPGGLARAFLDRAGAKTRWLGGHTVAQLVYGDGRWHAQDALGHTHAAAPVVILANGMDALRLLDQPPWPVEAVRGQISIASESSWQAAGLPHTACPVAGSGYLLSMAGGGALFGATSHPNDGHPLVRETDHQANLATLARLMDRPVDLPTHDLRGRVGWRCTSGDRMPIIGPVPQGVLRTAASLYTSEAGSAPDQARLARREPGLFVFTALGSRGITWSPLGARVLAACVSGHRSRWSPACWMPWTRRGSRCGQGVARVPDQGLGGAALLSAGVAADSSSGWGSPPSVPPPGLTLRSAFSRAFSSFFFFLASSRWRFSNE